MTYLIIFVGPIADYDTAGLFDRTFGDHAAGASNPACAIEHSGIADELKKWARPFGAGFRGGSCGGGAVYVARKDIEDRVLSSRGGVNVTLDRLLVRQGCEEGRRRQSRHRLKGRLL